MGQIARHAGTARAAMANTCDPPAPLLARKRPPQGRRAVPRADPPSRTAVTRRLRMDGLDIASCTRTSRGRPHRPYHADERRRLGASSLGQRSRQRPTPLFVCVEIARRRSTAVFAERRGADCVAQSRGKSATASAHSPGRSFKSTATSPRLGSDLRTALGEADPALSRDGTDRRKHRRSTSSPRPAG